MQAKAKFDVIMNCNVILLLYVYWTTPLLELLLPLYLYIPVYAAIPRMILSNSIRFLITDRTSLLFPVKLLYLTWLPHHVKLKIKQKVSTPEYEKKTAVPDLYVVPVLYYVMQRLLDSKNLIIESQSVISYRLGGKCELMKWWYPSFFSRFMCHLI